MLIPFRNRTIFYCGNWKAHLLFIRLFQRFNGFISKTLDALKYLRNVWNSEADMTKANSGGCFFIVIARSVRSRGVDRYMVQLEEAFRCSDSSNR